MNRRQLKRQLKKEMKERLQQEVNPSPQSYEESIKKMIYVSNLLSLIAFIPMIFIFLVVMYKCLQVVMKLDLVSMMSK